MFQKSRNRPGCARGFTLVEDVVYVGLGLNCGHVHRPLQALLLAQQSPGYFARRFQQRLAPLLVRKGELAPCRLTEEIADSYLAEGNLALLRFLPGMEESISNSEAFNELIPHVGIRSPIR